MARSTPVSRVGLDNSFEHAAFELGWLKPRARVPFMAALALALPGALPACLPLYQLETSRQRYSRGGRIAGAHGGVIPAETLVLNGTAGDNDTAGGTSNQPVLGFLVGRNPLWAAFRPVTWSFLQKRPQCEQRLAPYM